MDQRRSAIWFELAKNGLGFYFLWQQQDWFGASRFGAWTVYLVFGYLVISTLVTMWQVYKLPPHGEQKPEHQFV
jgi:hypothetical protein